MFEEPTDDPERDASNPTQRAKEKADEFRMHAELAAVFEGTRKYDAQVLTDLSAEVARDCQKTVGKLEKSKVEGGPLIDAPSMPEAARILDLPKTNDLSTNDYHIYRRPGEVMMVRWLAGEEVETFYTRLQAHFDAALNQFKDEERQSKEWKQDAGTIAYLDALDATKIDMAERYVRDPIRKHNVFVLSTQSADEIDILHLTDFIMAVPAEEIVGAASAPPDQPTEQDRAWFFKLFSLRGMIEGEERMCFFTYMQKTNNSDDSW